MTDLDALAAAATPTIVFRYKPNPLATPANDEPAMVVSALGRWVASDDYDAAVEERDRLRAAAESVIDAWSGSVKRLIETAPIRAVVEEVGIEETGHSTPPERRALRDKAQGVVDRWVARDRVALHREDGT